MSLPQVQISNTNEEVQSRMDTQDVWLEDVKLYQPYEDIQILLADNATALSVQTYFKMCDLDYTVIMMSNAAEMSPSGNVPFIKDGKFIIADLSPIIAHLDSKGIKLTQHLNEDEKADMKAYMTLVEKVLGSVENYVSWVDELNFNEVTKIRYGYVHPWPLNNILTWFKRREVLKKLKAYGYIDKTTKEIYDEVENCCKTLSDKLENKQFFYGSKPTDLDALVHGHIFSILTTSLPSNGLASIVNKYKNLVNLSRCIDKEYYGSSSSIEDLSEDNL